MRQQEPRFRRFADDISSLVSFWGETATLPTHGLNDMASPLSVLLVEDDEQDAFPAQKHLSRIGADSVVVSPTLKQAQQQIESRKFEIILCDLNLPDSIGVKRSEPGPVRTWTPVVVLTGSDDACSELPTWWPKVRRISSPKARIDTDRLNDINHALARQKLWVDAGAGLYDALTGLPGRALFREPSRQLRWRRQAA